MTMRTAPDFTVTRWKPGYAVEEVDAFLATIDTRTVEEIDAVVFRTTRLMGGYEEKEVDAYLDQCIAVRRQAQSDF